MKTVYEDELRENERIDDLERNGYRIIQNKSRFCFGMDAVLLSAFACEGETTTMRSNASDDGPHTVDLGTGTGIIPILMYGRIGKGIFIGLEIQEEMTDMALRSVRLNHLENSINIIQGDIKEASRILGTGKYDVVTSNPPYMKSGGGIANYDSSRAISRHEILCTFTDVAREAAALLCRGGRFYLVHRPERLVELVTALVREGLEPKRIRMVHSFSDSKAVMVLIESVKGGGTFLKVERPLIIYREKDVYTDEISKIYQF